MGVMRRTFADARNAAVEHMERCDGGGIKWGETTITEIILSIAAQNPAIQVRQFNQHEEGRNGADWL